MLKTAIWKSGCIMSHHISLSLWCRHSSGWTSPNNGLEIGDLLTSLSGWWWLEHDWIIFSILGISSSQLTKSIIFQRGRYTTNQLWFTQTLEFITYMRQEGVDNYSDNYTLGNYIEQKHHVLNAIYHVLYHLSPIILSYDRLLQNCMIWYFLDIDGYR